MEFTYKNDKNNIIKISINPRSKPLGAINSTYSSGIIANQNQLINILNDITPRYKLTNIKNVVSI